MLMDVTTRMPSKFCPMDSYPVAARGSCLVNSREGKTNAGKIGDALPSAVCYAFR